ncbi:hypothetical protein AVEN_102851-1 [Araneus ventricosus]|uniref:Uncharacterized protein n=1 Tax=Araneus ventricosus TaxID=182803 RepID=A0A4Y2LB68_ARAVE|nr:hypothetical protein AVEN_102851-1 [Araneus ventricosus]
MKLSHKCGRVRRQTHGCQSAHPKIDTLGTLDNCANTSLCSTDFYCPKGAHPLEALKKTLISLTLPQAYIPENDVKFYFASVLRAAPV